MAGPAGALCHSGPGPPGGRAARSQDFSEPSAAYPPKVPSRAAVSDPAIACRRGAPKQLPIDPSGTLAPLKERRDPGSLPRLRILQGAGLLGRAAAVITTAGVQHTTYQLRRKGQPIFNRVVRLHERGGRIVGRSGRLTLPPLSLDPPLLSQSDALDAAFARLGVRALRAAPRVERGLYAKTRTTVAAWRITLPALQPLGTWRITLSAETGKILSRENLLKEITGQGYVFPEDAVSTPTPTDLPLQDLDSSGLLWGRITKVFDIKDVEAFRPNDFFFSFPLNDPRFAQTSAHRGLTRTGDFAELHGFPSFPRPLVAFTNFPAPLAGGAFNNAFYDPLLRIFAFGTGDGTLTANLSTDSDVAAREMGHHLFQILVDPLVTSALSSLAAINEALQIPLRPSSPAIQRSGNRCCRVSPSCGLFRIRVTIQKTRIPIRISRGCSSAASTGTWPRPSAFHLPRTS